MRNDIIKKKEEIVNWINQNQSKAFMCKQLKCRPETLNNCLKKIGITYKGNRGGKGIKLAPNRMSALEYLEKDIITTSKLRKKLIEDRIKKNECEKCHIYEWLGQPLPLELHHKDGDRYNNKLNNLEILCPNCHSLTPNHSKKKQLGLSHSGNCGRL